MTERRIDAMMQLLRQKPRAFWTTDENRRTIEALAPKAYDDAGYYERWAYAMRGLLIEKGVLKEAEVANRLAEVKARFGSRTAKAKAAKGKAAAGAKPKIKPGAARPASGARRLAAKGAKAKGRAR